MVVFVLAWGSLGAMAHSDDAAFWEAFFSSDAMTYCYWLKAPKRVLRFPAQSRVYIEQDWENGCVLDIQFAGMGEVRAGFYAFKASFAQVDLGAYSDQQVRNILADIQSQFSFERFGEIAPGVNAVWMDEQLPDGKARHLMVFDGGWVYNSMMRTKGDAPIPAAAQEKQERLMRSMYTPEGRIVRTWDVGEGTILSLPDSFLRHEHAQQAGDMRKASLCVDETGQLLEMARLSVMALSAEEAKSQDVFQTLSTKLPGFEENRMFVQKVEGHPGILMYDTGDGKVYCAVDQGRILVAEENIYQDKSKDWQGDFSLAAMSALLGREVAWPVRLPPDYFTQKMGNRLIIPVGERRVRMAIPEGFVERIAFDREDAKLISLTGENGLQYTLRVMFVDAELSSFLAPDAPEREAIFANVSEEIEKVAAADVAGERLTAAYHKAALMGLPGGIITGRRGYLMAFCPLDRYMVVLSVFSPSAGSPDIKAFGNILAVE